MKGVLEQSSQALMLRGVVAIIFALLLLFVPGMTLAAGAFSFVILFGVYALVDGLSTIWGAVKNREGHWVLMLLVGIVSAIAGLLALGNPVVFGTLTLAILINLFAFKAVIGGGLEVISAFRLREEIDNEWLLGINGFVSLVFGLMLLFNTFETVAMLLLIVPFYLLVAGAMQIALSFKVRSWKHELAKA
ncbi:MAG: DUF308 domain-containing protein [Chloroflexi bacterium]|nr:DUF308 domain-containing protein [Chloroflexota bacterium]MCY3917165.1 DUF308 domain-containing protein [Chloroflexota bacterium]